MSILDNLILLPETSSTLNYGGKGHANTKIDFLAIIAILFINLVMKIKDILLYNLGYNRYVTCHIDWLFNVKPTLPNI